MHPQGPGNSYLPANLLHHSTLFPPTLFQTNFSISTCLTRQPAPACPGSMPISLSPHLHLYPPRPFPALQSSSSSSPRKAQTPPNHQRTRSLQRRHPQPKKSLMPVFPRDTLSSLHILFFFFRFFKEKKKKKNLKIMGHFSHVFFGGVMPYSEQIKPLYDSSLP